MDNDYTIDSPILEIIMNMILKKDNKNYLFVIASNKSRDWALLFIQESSYLYASKLYLDDFAKYNIFNKCSISEIVEIIINVFKDKNDLIKIEEEEKKQIKISIELEKYIKSIKLSLGKEKLEFILEKQDVDETIKITLFWFNILFLFQEKKENEKFKKEQEKKIEKLEKNLSEFNGLKKSFEHYNKKNNIINNNINIYNNNINNNNFENDFKKSKIINEFNIKNFNFIKAKLKKLNKEKNIKYKMIYSAKLNGDSSKIFHELCDNQNNTLVIIKTKESNIFGGFASKTWNSMELGRKIDLKSFLFSINNQKIYNPKLDDNQKRYHLFCSDKDGPCFYAFSVENSCLQNGGICDEINKCNYDSFAIDFEINKGKKKFEIDELEIYKILF